jgi:hypothetical protein
VNSASTAIASRPSVFQVQQEGEAKTLLEHVIRWRDICPTSKFIGVGGSGISNAATAPMRRPLDVPLESVYHRFYCPNAINREFQEPTLRWVIGEPVMIDCENFSFAEPSVLNVIVASGANTTFGEPLAFDGDGGTVIAPNWLVPLRSQIYGFSALTESWDGYRGKPVPKSVIGRAIKVAELLAEAVSESAFAAELSPFAAPIGSGAVMFEVRNRDRELHIDVQPKSPGEYGVLKIWRDRAGREFEQEYNVHESQLREVLAWIAGAS